MTRCATRGTRRSRRAWVPRLLAIGLASTIGLGLAACEPTGHPRCDAEWDIVTEINDVGYAVDCAPDHDNTFDGKGIAGLTMYDTKVVYLWPDVLVTRNWLRKVAWHELAHARGILDEVDADRYAYCREPLDGVAYRAIPTEADCARLGAR